MKKYLGLAIMFVMMSCFFFRASALAGSLEPSGSPSDSSTRMYSVEQIYDLTNTGKEPVLATSFSSPASSPASTFHTLSEVCDLLKTKLSACNATANDVLVGKYFFATQMTSGGTGIWGPTVGRYRPASGPTGNATENDVLSGKTFSNSSGTGKTGTLPTESLNPGLNAYPAGYHIGAASLTAVDSDLAAGNIKDDITIFGVEGTYTGGGGGLPKTGQKPGYPVGSPFHANDDGDLQKGNPVSPRFTAGTGAEVGTVTDNATGLMWEQKTNNDPPDIHDMDDTYVWFDGAATYPAFDFIDALNTASFAGHADWRLPNSFELYSIVDLGRVGPSINPIFNDGVNYYTQSVIYWSSTTLADNSDLAWSVKFYNGSVGYANKVRAYYVRAVRGGE